MNLKLAVMIDLRGKKVAICDYPSQYLFPPNGYGGIERWLYTVAKESIKLGMSTNIVGPMWQNHLLPQANHIRQSIISYSTESFLQEIGPVDFLVAGHEYWLNRKMLDKFDRVSNYSLTYQHAAGPLYGPGTFDNKKRFLFCYSDFFCDVFKDQKPTKLLCVSAGYDEDPIKEKSEDYLVFVGRLDEDKAPHYAISAAEALKMPIYIIGESVRDDNYLKRYSTVFASPFVHKLGVVFGHKKMSIIAKAACGVYATSRNYIEPAAGTIAEIIRSGVPLAAISWSGRDSVCEPFKIDPKIGKIEICDSNEDDGRVVAKLSAAIKYSLTLDRNYIFKRGNEIYNPTELVADMYQKALIG